MNLNRLLISLALLFLPPFAQALVPSFWVFPTEKNCRFYATQIETLTNERFVDTCGNRFYESWKDTDFKYTTAYSMRLTELQLDNETEFGFAIWMLYSRYSFWNYKESTDATLAYEMERALQFAEKIFSNPLWKKKAKFFYEIAFYLSLSGKYFEPKYYEKALHYLSLSETQAQIETNSILLRRSRMDQGHIYRQMGRREEARSAFQRVLDVNPADEAALRALKEL